MVAHEWLDRRGQTHRDATAVVCGRDTVTFGELRMRSRALASALAEHGAGKDGPVAALLPNSVELAYTYYACSYLGAPFLPFDPRLADEEIVRQCAAALPRALITRAEYAGLAASIRESTPDCEVVISAGGNWPDSSRVEPLHLAEVVESEAAAEAFEPAAVGPEDLTALLLTSGTTGHPKLAMLPARVWDTFIYALEKVWLLEEGFSHLLPVPASHIVGPVYLNACVYFAAKMVLMNRFAPRRLFALAKEHRPVLLSLAPSMMRVLLAGLQPDELRELGTTTRMVVFGAPMTPDLLAEITEKLGMPPCSGYGLTEVAPTVAVTPLSVGVHRFGSLGKPVGLPGNDVRVVDENGEECPTGETGEIVVRGPSLMTGYLNAPEATREVMRDGTFHTGDVGFFDKEGYLYISGRKKEIIIVHGFNVLPTEVESVLFIHQDVQEAAVVGEPDPHSGERVMAFVVRKPGATVTADELIALARNQLASYKVPRDVTFVDELPKTSVGKVDRAALRGEKQSSRPD